jgi:RNA recognition motif-containing protein
MLGSVEESMSTARLYVGNLSYGTTKETLEKAFGEHGEIVAVNIITDRQTGRPKGFAFVEMSTPEEAESAKTALNGTDIDGRTINVDNAREQEQRRPGGGGGYGGGGRGGYGGGGGGYGGGGGGGYGGGGGGYGGGRQGGSRW